MLDLASQKQIKKLRDQALIMFGDATQLEINSFFWHPMSLVQGLLDRPVVFSKDAERVISTVNVWLSADQIAKKLYCRPKHIEKIDTATEDRYLVVDVVGNPEFLLRAARSSNIELKSDYGYKFKSVVISKSMNSSGFFVITLVPTNKNL